METKRFKRFYLYWWFINALLKLFILKKKINPINISSGKSYTIRQMFNSLEKISDQKKMKFVMTTKPTMIQKERLAINI